MTEVAGFLGNHANVMLIANTDVVMLAATFYWSKMWWTGVPPDALDE